MTTKRIDSILVIAVALIGLGITLASFSMYAFAQGGQGLQRICPQGHQCSCINGIFRDYDPQTGKVFTLNNGCIE
jgi:hypothetical protein